MTLATVTCPSCGTPYELGVESSTYVYPCPSCGQRNTNARRTMPITGLCNTCSKPMDDHGFDGDGPRACPTSR